MTDLWNKYATPDKKYVKDVAYGSRKFKAINPEYDAMRATTEWGLYGVGWGLRDCEYMHFQARDSECLALKALFFYGEGKPNVPGNKGCFEIFVDMKFQPGDDCYKKLRTMAQSKALSLLGFNSTIFMGMWDDPKFVSELEVAQDSSGERLAEIVSAVKCSATEERVKACLSRARRIHANGNMTTEQFESVQRACDHRIDELSLGNAQALAKSVQATLRDMIGVDMEDQDALNAMCQWMVESDYPFVVSSGAIAERFMQNYKQLVDGGMSPSDMLSQALEEQA